MEKAKQIPFARIEKDVRHKYRKNLGMAESTEDVKKFFGYAVKDLFCQAFAEKIKVDAEDIQLAPELQDGFLISPQLKQHPALKGILESSGLARIIGRFAEKANNLIQHLEATHPDKTEVKMYPTPSHAGRFHHQTPDKPGSHN